MIVKFRHESKASNSCAKLYIEFDTKNYEVITYIEDNVGNNVGDSKRKNFTSYEKANTYFKKKIGEAVLGHWGHDFPIEIEYQ